MKSQFGEGYSEIPNVQYYVGKHMKPGTFKIILASEDEFGISAILLWANQEQFDLGNDGSFFWENPRVKSKYSIKLEEGIILKLSGGSYLIQEATYSWAP